MNSLNRKRPNAQYFFMAGTITILSILGYYNLGVRIDKTDAFKYDEDMSYVYQLEALENTIDYLNKNKLNEDSIACFFPLNYALEDSKHGYRSNEEKCRYSNKITNGNDYVVIFSPPGFRGKLDNWNHELIYENQHYYCNTKIYKLLEKK